MDEHWLLGGNNDFAPSETLSSQQSGEVTIEGNLNKVNLVDIFKTITESKLIGTLYITRGNFEKCLFFRRGGLAIDSVGGEQKKRIGETMMDLGFITMEQLNEVLAEKKTGLPVGQQLIAKGYTTQEHIDLSIKHQMKQEVCDMFQWRHADFRFFQGEDPSEHADIDQVLKFTNFNTVEYLIRQSEIFQTLQRLQDKVTIIMRNEVKEVHLAFTQNRIAMITIYAPKTVLIGELLIQHCNVTTEQVEQALQEQEENYRPIGEILCDMGYVTRSEVEGLLEEQISQEVFSMFASPTLQFSYVEGKTSEFTSLASQVAVSDFDQLEMILSAFRHLENLTDFYSILPNAFGVLPFQAGNIIDINEINLYQSTQEICSRINRPFNVQELVFATEMSPFQLAIMSCHMIRDGLIKVNNDIRELSKLYKINTQWENFIAALELQFTFSPRDLPLIYSLGEIYETHNNPQRAGEFYLLAGDLSLEDPDNQLEAYKKVLQLSPSKEAYQRVIQILLEKEQAWDAGDLAKQYVDMLSPETELLEIEELARTMIKAKSNVEFFHQKLIEIYKGQANSRLAVRELELLKSYYREEGRDDEVSRLEKEILAFEEKSTQPSSFETKTTRKRKPRRAKMSPLLRAMVLGILLFVAVASGGLYIFIKKPELLEDFLITTGIRKKAIDPLQKSFENLRKEFEATTKAPTMAKLDNLSSSFQGLERSVSILSDPQKKSQYETELANLSNEVDSLKGVLHSQEENFNEGKRYFDVEKNYEKAQNYYELVAKSTQGDTNLIQIAKTRLKEIENFNITAENLAKQAKKSIEDKNLPAAWISYELLIKRKELHGTTFFKELRFPYMVMVSPPLPALYKGKFKLEDYPTIVWEKLEEFNANQLKALKEERFEIIPLDPKKRLNLDEKDFQEYKIRDLTSNWIKIFRAQHKVNWSLSLGNGNGFVLSKPITLGDNVIFGATNRNLYEISANGRIAKETEIGKQLTEDIYSRVLEMRDYLVVCTRNGKLTLVRTEDFKRIGTYTIKKNVKTAKLETDPLRLGDSKTQFVLNFQGSLYRFKIQPRDKDKQFKLQYRWQIPSSSSGNPAYYNKKVYLGDSSGQVYAIPVNKKTRNIKPIYAFEGKEEIVGKPIIYEGLFFFYSKTGSIHVLNPEGRVRFVDNIPGKPNITNMVMDSNGEGNFYFGSSNGKVYCWHWGGAEGKIRWEYELEGQSVTCPPVVLGDYVYFGSEGRSAKQSKGTISCFRLDYDNNPKKAFPVWSHRLDEKVVSIWKHQNMIVASLKNGEIVSFME